MQSSRLSCEAFQLADSAPYRAEKQIRNGSNDTSGLARFIIDMHDEALQRYIDAVCAGKMRENEALRYTGLSHDGFRMAAEACKYPQQRRKDAFLYIALSAVSQSLIKEMLDYWQALFNNRNLFSDLVTLIADFLDDLSFQIINGKLRSEQAFTRSILRQVGNFEVNNSTSETVSFLPLKKWGTH